ncbi:hypothetical protein [Reinekea sp. G2M2-21]|uniref:hypothetical protein n=1 Tax=Reinekea sp. G2M2-21 TaxID=2788942 RepID=UPI0018AC787C|nr:hypothetical protein [Reinekea sp. G2M2-21]
MNFTKAMIDLAKEIRRRAESDDKPSIKMANPELFSELAIIYQRTNDAVMKALIKEICQLADSPVLDAQHESEQNEKHSQLVYRGQVRNIPKPIEPTESDPHQKPRKIYRGQVVQHS